MPSTFGQWLILILALLVGLAAGWVVWGRQAAASPTAPIVEGDPVAEATEVSAPTTTNVDHERPEAVVDEVPPPAVTEQPAPAEYDAPPAAATLAANATTLPSADERADHTEADSTEAAPAEVEATSVTAAEPAEAEPAHPEEPATPVTAEVEPIHAEEPVTPAAAEAEPTQDEEPAARPATVVADAEPAEQQTPTADEAAVPVVVPAPRAAAEDSFTPDAATTPAQPETVAAPAIVANGAAPAETADDFRRIQGIGPKLATALQAAGIRTYRQLGDLDEAALRGTIRAAGLRAAASLATWPQQAKVLAGARAEADQVLPAEAGEDA
ncbi:hypothetical protein [Micromonospora sp. RTP1Z1]|uniref:hypothetical protein n=1 Tax=Micromonospora sp. RTP1Z1 TaxID=2994043 RepID=UPI0029C8B53E|nr:hypothetical protein [Micromonospora sp. RTP1Z1]